MRAKRASKPRFLASATLALALLTACTSDEDPGDRESPAPAGASPSPTLTATIADDEPDAPDVDDPALDEALSTPREDSVYPHVGDPSVDALRYHLELAWTPATETLEGLTTIVLRSTSSERLQLDLAESLEVSSVTLDGEPVEYEHVGKDLVINADVEADGRYVLAIRYSGTPRPTAAPTTREDFSTSGWHIHDEGYTWTMQEPYGAFTWYPVNDQPADKALYDFTITVPSPGIGVANGELMEQTSADGLTTTRWHLDEPAASYLITVATGEYTHTTNTTPRTGLEISYWVPTPAADLAEGLYGAAGAMEWLQARLGPYPFDTLGFLLVPNRSGMETQTMVTLGITDYTTSMPVLVHEMAHHWYGDEVTPNDWRDMWMNEGMVMYLQGLWEAEQDGITAEQLMDEWATFEDDMREESGPPGNYDPAEFGEGNVYYGPALMWHELRKRLGDEEFFAMMRAWPRARSNQNSNREDYLAWIEDRTGEELTAFFDAWLLGETTPPRE